MHLSHGMWLLAALIIQSVIAVSFAALSRSRIAHPIRKIFLVLAVTAFFHTLLRFIIEWQSSWAGNLADFHGHMWEVIAFLFIYLLVVWVWSLAMLGGSLVLSTCQLGPTGLFVNPKGPAAWVIRLLKVDINDKSNICNLSWSMSGRIAFYIIVIPIVAAICLATGLVAFLTLGRQPFRGFQRVFGNTSDWETWHTVKLGPVPIIPSVLFVLYIVVRIIIVQLGLAILLLAGGFIVFMFIVAYILSRYFAVATAFEYKKSYVPTGADKQIYTVMNRAVVPVFRGVAFVFQSAWSAIISPVNFLLAIKKGACPQISWSKEQ